MNAFRAYFRDVWHGVMNPTSEQLGAVLWGWLAWLLLMSGLLVAWVAS